MKCIKQFNHLIIIRLIAALTVSLNFTSAVSQTQEFTIEFDALFNNESIVSNSNRNFLYREDTIQIETFRIYISDFKFLKNGEIVCQEENSFHLLDIKDPSSFSKTFQLQNEVPDEVTFTVGIDSLTNVSGAMGGDLDPTKGMYWAWNSGYINCKLEGTHPLSSAQSNKFQFHLGGYLPPYQSYRSLNFAINNQKSTRIGININEFLDQVDLKELNHIMSPGIENKKASETLSATFKIL